MKVLKTEANFNIDKHAPVTVERAGPITKIMYISYKNKEAYIRKLNADEYLLLKSGEIKKFNKTENRAESLYQISVSLDKIRGYINANVKDKSRCHWVTLTYKQRQNQREEAVPMRDPKRLYFDFQNCIRAIRLDYPNNKIEYIGVAEPQQSGSWHMHMILIWDCKAPFLANKVLRYQYWRQGFVTINRISPFCDNVGAYFSAYLADLEYNEGDPLKEGDIVQVKKDSKGKTKKFIKGGRLHFYPAGMNIYRCSRGIKPPTSEETTYSEAKQKNLGVCTYRKQITLIGEDTKPICVMYEYYNSDRVVDRQTITEVEEVLKRSKGEI